MRSKSFSTLIFLILGPRLTISKFQFAIHNLQLIIYNLLLKGGMGDSKGTVGLLTSVELLFLNDFESHNYGWTPGPELSTGIRSSTLVEYQNGLILVGGKNTGADNHFYQLSSPRGPWITMEQTLIQERYLQTAFLIPDKIANCH